uniref:Uncharacterized protein n=1 Tax=Cannabis sativa TaxID=3483 RepID=A0A803NL97_CANSA
MCGPPEVATWPSSAGWAAPEGYGFLGLGAIADISCNGPCYKLPYRYFLEYRQGLCTWSILTLEFSLCLQNHSDLDPWNSFYSVISLHWTLELPLFGSFIQEQHCPSSCGLIPEIAFSTNLSRTWPKWSLGSVLPSYKSIWDILKCSDSGSSMILFTHGSVYSSSESDTVPISFRNLLYDLYQFLDFAFQVLSFVT